MRAAAVLLLTVVVATVTGCSPQTVTGAASTGNAATPTATPTATAAPTTDATYVVAPSADDNGLVSAQYPQCAEGPQILRYLATGDNGGDPGMDQVFASYVGTSKPQARALADQWIQACDRKYAQQEAAASSSAAQARAEASYEAAQSAAEASTSASEAQHEATVKANQQRTCAAIGGGVSDGLCRSTLPGNSTATDNVPCSSAVVSFDFDGIIEDTSLTDTRNDYPGCWR